MEQILFQVLRSEFAQGSAPHASPFLRKQEKECGRYEAARDVYK